MLQQKSIASSNRSIQAGSRHQAQRSVSSEVIIKKGPIPHSDLTPSENGSKKEEVDQNIKDIEIGPKKSGELVNQSSSATSDDAAGIDRHVMDM